MIFHTPFSRSLEPYVAECYFAAGRRPPLTEAGTLKRSSIANAIFTPFLAWWGTWAVLAIAGSYRMRRNQQADATPVSAGSVKFDIVIPAHDEALTLPNLLRSLRAGSNPDFINNVLVVADHCNDDTADVARKLDALVLERGDGNNGKSLAMQEGFALLSDREDRADTVVVIDADCICNPDYFAHLSSRFTDDISVVQGSYVQDDDQQDSVRSGLRLSVALRNVLRPAGSRQLGLPGGLFGSGMALRWSALQFLTFGDTSAQVSGAKRREPTGVDVTMWLDLLENGVHPQFEECAALSAPSPTDDAGMTNQRLRWESAQFRLWLRAAVSSKVLVKRRDWRALLAILDWSAPPLALAVTAWSAMTALVGLLAIMRVLPLRSLKTAALSGSALVTYLAVGAGTLEGKSGIKRVFLGGPAFIVWKLRAYVSKAR